MASAASTLATVLLPDRMEPRLLVARDWIGAHGASMTAVVMILIGIVVIAAGTSR